MARTYQQQLDDVDAAIAKIERLGQSHGADGRSLSRADLATLYKRQNELTALAAREAAGGITVRAGTPVDA